MSYRPFSYHPGAVKQCPETGDIALRTNIPDDNAADAWTIVTIDRMVYTATTAELQMMRWADIWVA